MEPDTSKIKINPKEGFDKDGNIIIKDDPRPLSSHSKGSLSRDISFSKKTMLELPVQKKSSPTLRECIYELGNMIKRSLSSSSERQRK